MLNNPLMMNMILESPQLKPMLDANPQLRAMFSNPQTLQAMLNPEAIQQAMSMMGGSGAGALGSMGGMGTNPFNIGNPPNTNTETTTTNNNNNDFMNNPFLFAPQVTSKINILIIDTSVNENVDPKLKYKEQNEKLKDMGFINDELNLEVLAKTNGNVDAAVERLLNMFN
jgi:ubiquilin